MQKVKKIGRIFSTILTVLLVVILVFNLITIILRHVQKNPYATVGGITTAVVVSGSMEPEISINDLAVIVKQKEYVLNDVITYVSQGGSLITHRIVNSTEEGFVTKGDFNNAEDIDPVAPEQVVGKVVWVIPGVGAVQEFITTPLGMLCITLLGFVMVSLSLRQEKEPENDEG